MAYGKGDNEDRMKRMASMGMVKTSPKLAALRLKFFDALETMAKAAWPDDILDPVLSAKQMDAILMPVQAACTKAGLMNNVWLEKSRLEATDKVRVQWKRSRTTLFGKFRHVGALTNPEHLKPGIAPKLMNLPDEWTEKLSSDDVAVLQKLADGCDFDKAMVLFRSLRTGDAGLTRLQADALRAILDAIRLRFGVPVWRRDHAIVQLHLDYRCFRNGRNSLKAALDGLNESLKSRTRTRQVLQMAAAKAFGASIPLPFDLTAGVVKAHPNEETQRISSLVVEIGPSNTEALCVVTRLPKVKPVAGHDFIVAEDFGYRNTSTMAVIRTGVPISQEAVDRVAGHNGVKNAEKIGKKEARTYLETHVVPDGVETIYTVQFDGRDFLARINVHALRVDFLRSEIDRMYNRLQRIRLEMNFDAGVELENMIPEQPLEDMSDRWMRMHKRFFRLHAAINVLKAKRRAVYRSVDGLKRSWFGHITTKQAELAEKYGAVVVREDLTVVTEKIDDPRYKGRTFNKMINNGSKGQYILRSENKLEWRGIPCVRIPSYYTSTTDTRTAKVDRRQRKSKGRQFVAASDGKRSDADIHAAETIGHYLVLVPKPEIRQTA